MRSWMERTRDAALEETEAESAPNPANVAANPLLATIKVDAQGDTVEDPIVIDEATSNSDNDSTEGTDKTTWAPKQIRDPQFSPHTNHPDSKTYTHFLHGG